MLTSDRQIRVYHNNNLTFLKSLFNDLFTVLLYDSEELDLVLNRGKLIQRRIQNIINKKQTTEIDNEINRFNTTANHKILIK